MGVVYLIHLERPLGNGKQKHYVGYTEDFEKRISQHRSNEGSQFLKAANEQGINWIVVRVWRDATLEDERRIKHQTTRGTCPVCRQKWKDLKERQVSIANSRLVEEKRSSRVQSS